MVIRELCHKYKLDLLVKAHPRDNLNNYKSIISNDGLLPLETSMDEFSKRVSISIGHTTGAIFDLIYDGKIVFQYIDDKKFPVKTLDSCKFRDEKELEDIYVEWNDRWDVLTKEYIDKVVPEYHVKNARILHDQFFADLLEKIG